MICGSEPKSEHQERFHTFPNSSGSTSSNVVQCRPITQHCPTLPGVQPALSPRREHCCVPHNMQRSRTRGTNASVMKPQSNFGLEPKTLQSNFIATSMMGFFSFYLIQVPRVAVQRLHCTSSSLTWPTFLSCFRSNSGPTLWGKELSRKTEQFCPSVNHGQPRVCGLSHREASSTPR